MLSIIIPVYNQYEMTCECLKAIRDNTENYEIILIDNGSSPALSFLSDFDWKPYDKIIRNEENLGFPAAINQGIKEATGDIICLLNNDVMVTPDWAAHLINKLDKYDIIGPMANYCAGLQQVIIPVYQDQQQLNKQAIIWRDSQKVPVIEVNWIIGFCMLFKKSLSDEIGDFDDTLWPCSGEEIDFCLRAKAKGYKVAIIRDVYVHHYGSCTFAEMQERGMIQYNQVCTRNDDHLSKKWGPKVFHQELAGYADNNETSIKLNLGCGYNKVNGFINIDNRGVVNPDLVCDVLKGLPYEDSSVDEVRAYDFLEHIPIGKTVQVITEIWRVLKHGGRFDSFTPSTDGRGAFMDPTHVSFWNANSWLYYTNEAYRKLYDIEANFKMIKVEDIKSDIPPMVIHTHVIAIAEKEEKCTKIQCH